MVSKEAGRHLGEGGGLGAGRIGEAYTKEGHRTEGLH